MKWGLKRIGKLGANNDADWEENRSHAGFSFSDAVILYAGLLNLAKQWRLAMGAGKRREFASFNGVALSRPSASHSTNFKNSRRDLLEHGLLSIILESQLLRSNIEEMRLWLLQGIVAVRYQKP